VKRGTDKTDGRAPLIEQLANTQFRSDLDRLWAKGALRLCDPESRPQELPTCRCGCGQSLGLGRKFANQVHYNTWRAKQRRDGKKSGGGSLRRTG
jgi:hypothetical protein